MRIINSWIVNDHAVIIELEDHSFMIENTSNKETKETTNGQV